MPNPLLIAGAAKLGSQLLGGMFGGGTGNPILSKLKNPAIRRAYEKAAAREGLSLSDFVKQRAGDSSYLNDPRLYQTGILTGSSGFVPSGQSSSISAALQGDNPDFQYWEPYTTQSDINAAESMGKYEGMFQDAASRYGDYQDRAFNMYEQAMQRGAPENIQMDWDRVGDLANRAAYGQNYWLTHGTAGTEGSVQGDLQTALQQSVGTGFGASGTGAIGNALTNTTARILQQNLESSDRNLATFGGIEQQDVASQRQAAANYLQAALSGAQTYGAEELSALESAYGVAATVPELIFQRSGERENGERMAEAWPSILESLQPTGFLEGLAQNSIYDVIFNEQSKIPGAIGDIWDWGKDIFGGIFSGGSTETSGGATHGGMW